MHLKGFLGLVEIRTKVASAIPLLLGTVYVLYRYDTFDFTNFLLFFCSLILIDMSTTALNNYFDWKRANKRHGYNYEIHNSIEKYRLKDKSVVAVILVMLLSAMVIGIVLVIRTNLVVLAVGALSFFIGIIYSFGPLPISRTPLGEALSGFFMGFVIVFLAIYVHAFKGDILAYTIEGTDILLRIGMEDIIFIFLVSLPLLCGIANIMLANNICDVEDDIENGRHTLPVYIGKKRSVVLLNALYYTSYADILFLVLIGVLPIFSLSTLLTLIPVYKGIKLFNAVQSKKDTFSVTVKSFMMIGTIMAVTIFISWILQKH
ncbi:MAG: 1,4-dihydroxy-2-naphthoate polyprenyltransferase [Ruminiclostridium sp.]|nr:1,4-dihydroxy-2-naphthoate polyprenyltransferase [Ruminiclostridium sp.]